MGTKDDRDREQHPYSQYLISEKPSQRKKGGEEPRINTPISETRLIHSQYIKIDAIKENSYLTTSRVPAYVRGWGTYIRNPDF